MTWDDLEFWRGDAWKTIQEKLDKWDKDGVGYNPAREDIFAAMDRTPFEDVKVVLMGQDPYPNSKLATGLAFDIPEKETKFPPTLHVLLNEYTKDLHYKYPQKGSLKRWAAQGVLLWNASLTCFDGQSNSHIYMWDDLTREICQRLNNVVFILTGSSARRFAMDTGYDSPIINNYLIETSHPSPRGNLNSRSPFTGSRVFSTANGYLCKLERGPINWRLE